MRTILVIEHSREHETHQVLALLARLEAEHPGLLIVSKEDRPPAERATFAEIAHLLTEAPFPVPSLPMPEWAFPMPAVDWAALSPAPFLRPPARRCQGLPPRPPSPGPAEGDPRPRAATAAPLPWCTALRAYAAR